MPWKMIVLLVVLVIFAFFSGFNMNPVDISIGFHVFKNIPLFLSLIIAFIAGALIMLPFTLRGFRRAKKADKKKGRGEEIIQEEATPPPDPEEAELGKKKK